ncbi:MAG: hypothetical protein AAB353_06385 [Candidatus Hydrogenedentota bacterium]
MRTKVEPGFRPTTILLCALSLSIGWGIRGNFGHEYGAMIPGCLTAIAVCLLSGREDWRERVAYFAFFGALGWGFGGSISYMQVIAYTHSGDITHNTLPYGFAALFLIGFLWAALGGAGTALPAVLTRQQLTALLPPLVFIFSAWWVWTISLEPWFDSLRPVADATWNRHDTPLYWFDSDWTKALTALVGVCLYDIWQRRVGRATPIEIAGLILVLAGLLLAHVGGGLVGYLVVAIGGVMVVAYVIQFCLAPLAGMCGLALVGAGTGCLVQSLLRRAGLEAKVGESLTRYAGDVGLVERAKELGINDPSFTEQQRNYILSDFQNLHGGDIAKFRDDLATNWPGFLHDFPGTIVWIGPVLGGIAGIALYFALFGKFANHSKLFLYMALGWFGGFLLLPVALGIRMTPPRGDDWAGILGVAVALSMYCARYNLMPVAYASLICGGIGGIGFSGTAFIKLVMLRPGNPSVSPEAWIAPDWLQGVAVGRWGEQLHAWINNPEVWRYYQSANWHSFLEQTYGFINGIAVAIAMALLARHVKRHFPEPRTNRWTEVFSVAFVLTFVVYVNWSKAIRTWVEHQDVPERMKMFWFQSIEMSVEAWFGTVFWIVSGVIIVLLARHISKPIPIVPATNLGKGMLLYLAFLWVCVIFNFERAITGFSEGRLITEGVIFVNAAIATALLAFCARPEDRNALYPPPTRGLPVGRACVAVAIMFVATVAIGTAGTHFLYRGAFAGHSGRDGHSHYRFGPDAEWRIRPLLKSKEHS